MVLSIKPDKQNAVVSRRALLEHAQKALVENLQEGQVLEGIVKNITNFGVFVELATGIVGLVYVKETVWDKKVNHPEQAKDEEGNPLFVEGRTGQILRLTKAQPNPWDDLPARKDKLPKSKKGYLRENTGRHRRIRACLRNITISLSPRPRRSCDSRRGSENADSQART